jgi:hypothetical protein
MKKKNAPIVDHSFTSQTTSTKREEVPLYKPPEETHEKKHSKKEHVHGENCNHHHDDVQIEEEKYQPEKKVTSQTQSTGSPMPGMPGNMNYDDIQKGRDQLKNMSPEQIASMTSTFKNMDSSFLKQMMKSQMGVDLSEADIERMKQQMSPEMLANMGNMEMPKNMTMPQSQASGPSNSGSSAQPSSAGGLPNMANMAGGMPDMNPEMVKTMMGMLEQNPEMLKSMTSMLGENHPVSNFLANKTPDQLRNYVRILKKLVGCFFFVSPVLKVLKKYWQLILGLLAGYIMYRLLG